MKKSEELSNSQSCLNKASDTEMLFVLLGRDPAFAGTVRDWAQRRVRMGLNSRHDVKILSAIIDAGQVEAQMGAAKVPDEGEVHILIEGITALDQTTYSMPYPTMKAFTNEFALNNYLANLKEDERKNVFVFIARLQG